jgi:hypothetical protein
MLQMVHFASFSTIQSYAPNVAICQFLYHTKLCSKCSTLPVSAPYKAMLQT